MMGVDHGRLDSLDNWLDGLHHLQEAQGIELLVGKVEKNGCVGSKYRACLQRSGMTVGQHRVAASGDTIGHEHDVDGIALPGVPRHRSTAPQRLVVCVRGDDQYPFGQGFIFLNVAVARKVPPSCSSASPNSILVPSISMKAFGYS